MEAAAAAKAAIANDDDADDGAPLPLDSLWDLVKEATDATDAAGRACWPRNLEMERFPSNVDERR